MITENDVCVAAARFLGDVDYCVRRSTGGFSKFCGYEVKILDDIPGMEHSKFFHETNTNATLVSKMIEFAENALNV